MSEEKKESPSPDAKRRRAEKPTRCSTCGATSRDDPIGKFCSNGYHGPIADWATEIAQEWYDDGTTAGADPLGAKNLAALLRERLGEAVALLEHRAELADHGARRAIAALRSRGGRKEARRG